MLFAVVSIVDIVDLITSFFRDPGELSDVAFGALYVRSLLALLGEVLLALGLVGLYARQADATGILGLIGFLVAFSGTVLALQVEDVNWAASFAAGLGWILFGASSLRARVYPRMVTILLIISAAISGVFNPLILALMVGPGSELVYVGVGAGIIFNAAIAWLGYALFSGRGFFSCFAFKSACQIWPPDR